MAKQLFSVPVASTNGNFTCTIPFHKHDNVYLLTFTSPADNRLTPAFLDAFLLSLDILEHQYPHGILITTSGIQKFFSNGLDLESALSSPGFFENHLYPLFRRLLTYDNLSIFRERYLLSGADCCDRYPMPTIALINGHAFAGGFMIAMYHDYRIQNPKRGFLCLNEIVLGIPLKPPMRSVFMVKVQDGAVIRSMILEGKRFTAQEALEAKIVDGLGDLPEALRLIHDKSLLEIGRSPSFVPLKERLWASVLDSIDQLTRQEGDDESRAEKTVAASQLGKTRVQQWKKSKL